MLLVFCPAETSVDETLGVAGRISEVAKYFAINIWSEPRMRCDKNYAYATMDTWRPTHAQKKHPLYSLSAS